MWPSGKPATPMEKFLLLMNSTSSEENSKPPGVALKFAAARRIAAQRENVFAAQRADFFQQRADFGARVVDAGEMRERGQFVLALDAVHDHQVFSRVLPPAP
jgi:L-fucose mutarotase/ribose pyranase (RbsD/FucU family)